MAVASFTCTSPAITSHATIASPVPFISLLSPNAYAVRASLRSDRSSSTFSSVTTHVTAVENAFVEEEPPVAIVTGASKGIGKAVALALGKAGCKVLTIDGGMVI